MQLLGGTLLSSPRTVAPLHPLFRGGRQGRSQFSQEPGENGWTTGASRAQQQTRACEVRPRGADGCSRGAGGAPTGGSSRGEPGTAFSPSSCGGLCLVICNLRSHRLHSAAPAGPLRSLFLALALCPPMESSVYSPLASSHPQVTVPATTVTHFVPFPFSPHSSPLPGSSS